MAIDSPGTPAARRAFVAAVLLLLAAGASPALAKSATDLTQIGFEKLLDLEVSTASRKRERWSQAGVAVHVITSDDLRRLGVTSIPEALRLVPGVQVARIDASKWAIGVRGFTSRLSRSLLVMIDGRTVYSPLFAGVYWEVQDTLIQDVDRIEVIRGPGGTLWGANAVNGVINIITKPAAATVGTIVSGGGGIEDKAFASGRVGRAMGDTGHARVWGKGLVRDPQFHETGVEFDEFWMGRGGFRGDWEPRPDTSASLQAEVYAGRAGQATAVTSFAPPFSRLRFGDVDLGGGHVLGNWQRRAAGGMLTQWRFYYDRTERKEPTFGDDLDTLDLDFQQHWTRPERHDVVWGAGWRVLRDRTSGVATVQFEPDTRTDNLFSAFIQDEIRLTPGVSLTIGSKFEHNDYSGFEVQPAAGLVWLAGSHTLWGRVARAVRTPSRIEHDLLLTALLDPTTPTFARLVGNRDFTSEQLTTAEAGYHGEPGPGWFLSTTVFFNRYDDLLSVEPGALFNEPTPAPAHDVVPFVLGNNIEGRGRGAEVLLERQFGETFRLAGSYSFLDLDLRPDPGSTDTSTEASIEGSSYRHQGYLRGSWNPGAGFEIETQVRYAGALPAQNVGDYVEMNAAVHWPINPRLRLSLVGTNLLHSRHQEFGGGAFPTEIERGAFVRLTGRW